ncbi:Graves disease carrier protein [Amphibalanus amphitrite]|uniref:Graves disease carrier protein n=1 Tax=Amphibalanus amphitrite TaxID=1232801 RepID=A0A6A4WK53_AMPAM|nr:Graves disease carrier protein [Amphibalanus amphitrite]
MKENEPVTHDARSLCKAFLAGGVAGMCAKTTVAPLDRIKILLQAHNKHYKHHGVFSGLLNIVRQERFLALYKGNGAQMVRVFPYAATQFAAFEIYKQTFRSLLGPNSHIGTFASGSLAGVTAVFFTYPLDTIRARLAFQVTGEHKYTGILHVASSIVKEEDGPRALYRRFAATMCMSVCGLVLAVPAKLLCGGMAGACAQSVSYPFDVTRRRMQLAYMSPETRKFGMGMVQTLRIIHKENGVVRGLYRGMSINYLRAIPMVAVSFSTYELMKQTLHLDTGIKVKVG